MEDKKELITLSVQMGYMQKGFESLEKKIDTVISSKADKKDLEEVKKDVKTLMNWRYYFTGAAAAIGAIMTLVIEWFKGNAR